MSFTVESVLADSEEIKRLNDRIETTYRERNVSPQKKEEWKEACKEFYKTYNKLFFPGGEKMLSLVRSGDSDAISNALIFLLADPYHFRSGYTKEYLWKWFQNLEVSSKTLNSLEIAALKYLDRKLSREFWNMCKTMGRLASADFWMKVLEVAESNKPPKSKRALYLLSHGISIQFGAATRRRVYREILREKYN